MYTRNMKKSFYIFLFTVFTLLLSLLVHVALEWPALWIITNNFAAYSESFVWQHWDTIHAIGGALLWVAGLAGGVYGGLRYWRILYIEERFGKPRW